MVHFIEDEMLKISWKIEFVNRVKHMNQNES